MVAVGGVGCEVAGPGLTQPGLRGPRSVCAGSCSPLLPNFPLRFLYLFEMQLERSVGFASVGSLNDQGWTKNAAQVSRVSAGAQGCFLGQKPGAGWQVE